MKFLSLLHFAFAASVLAAPSTDGPIHTGNAIVANFGLGACGRINNNNELVVGVSQAFFNDFPGATTNPNDNPICGRKIKASLKGRSVTVAIVDDCIVCGKFDLNLSPTAFDVLADERLGRIHNVTWFVIGGEE